MQDANLKPNQSKNFSYGKKILKQLILTDFKLRYQGSILGYLWSLLRPVALFAILYLVFGVLLKVGADIDNYASYLLFGIVVWNYFAEMTNTSLESVVEKGELMRKIYFPRQVIVLASSASATINLILSLLVVGVLIVVEGGSFTNLWLAPLLFVELFVFSLGVSFLLSALYVRYRDIKYVWELVLQAGFYATPILYPMSFVIDQSPFLAKLLLLNPMAQIIQDLRFSIVSDQSVTLSALSSLPLSAIPLSIVGLTIIVGVWHFASRAEDFAEEA